MRPGEQQLLQRDLTSLIPMRLHSRTRGNERVSNIYVKETQGDMLCLLNIEHIVKVINICSVNAGHIYNNWEEFTSAYFCDSRSGRSKLLTPSLSKHRSSHRSPLLFEHSPVVTVPWVFPPRSWVFGSQTANPSFDARPDPAALRARPPAPCCPPETPAAPPEPPGSCEQTEEEALNNQSRQKEVVRTPRRNSWWWMHSTTPGKQLTRTQFTSFGLFISFLEHFTTYNLPNSNLIFTLQSQSNLYKPQLQVYY